MTEPLHSWDLAIAEARALQERLARSLVPAPPPGFSPRYVAGVDVSAARFSPTMYAAAVVVELPDLAVVDTATAVQTATFPYVPGYLSFREAPIALEALSRLAVRPDCVMCDGQGIAHPRGLGLASHMGLWLALPTLGVAKSRLIGEHGDPPPERGAWSPLTHKGREIGAVVRTRQGVKPLFISPGHLMDLPTAIALTLACGSGRRIPEPTRQAHIAVEAARRGARPAG